MKTGRKKAALFAGLFLCLLLILPPVPARAASAVTVIRTAEDLAAFSQAVGAGETYAGRTVTLAADIDMTGRDFTAVGVWAGDDYSRVFQGVFDGDGHAVTGLTVTAAPGSTAMGFFSGLYNATVKNLTLTVTVAANGAQAAGGLAGRTVNAGLSRVSADVYVTAAAWPAPDNGCLASGGLVGLADGRTAMDRCAVRGHVGAAGSFAGSVYAGGLVGCLRSGGSDGAVTNCYSTAGMYVNDRGVYVGGLLGGALADGGYTVIQNCYGAAGMLISGDDLGGGFAGAADGSLLVQNVWYDADLAADLPNGGNAPLAGLTGAPTAQMQSRSFPDVLGDAFALDSRGENGGYPILAYEVPAEPTAAPTDTPTPTQTPPAPTGEPFPTQGPAPTGVPAPTAPPVVPTSPPFPSAPPMPTRPPVTSPPIPAPTAEPYGPRTGDDTAILPWLALLGLGGTALAWLVRRHMP